MRLKKLRISVAVSLALFIFIVGTILAFGFINSHQNSGDDSNILQLAPPTYTNKNPTQNQIQPVQTPQQTQPTTIFHTRVISGAS